MEQTASGRSIWLKSKPVRFLFACIVSAMLVFGLSGAAVFRYSIVVTDGTQKTIVYTSLETPEAILSAEGISVGPYDEIVYDVSEGRERAITIHRASRVTVQVDGTTRSFYRTSGTVGEALDALGITVNDSDYINVSLQQPVTIDGQPIADGLNVVVNRITTRTVAHESTVPFTVTKIPTQTLDKGETKTLTPGINGVQQTTVKQTLLDGKVIDEDILAEEVIQKPVNSQILIGDPSAPVSELTPAKPIALDKNGNPVNYKYVVTGRATAYSALGRPTKLKPGAVAMNLADFPRGTKLYIKTPDGSFTYGYAEVRDTGTAVNDGTCLVDLFFDSYRESCLFGVKEVEIYVLA